MLSLDGIGQSQGEAPYADRVEWPYEGLQSCTISPKMSKMCIPMSELVARGMSKRDVLSLECGPNFLSRTIRQRESSELDRFLLSTDSVQLVHGSMWNKSKKQLEQCDIPATD